MTSILNKITGKADTRAAENRHAATTTTTTPHSENLQQGTLRQEPRYQENVHEGNIGRTDHGRVPMGDSTMGHEGLRRTDFPVDNNIPHHGHGATRTGHAENVYEDRAGHSNQARNALGHDGLRQNDVPVQGNIPHHGHGATRTGHAENVYEDRAGYTNQARHPHDGLRRHDGPIESNMPYENNVGETSYVRTGMGQHNLERHDAPVHRTMAHQEGHTVKTGPVHNSEVLNKLDPRVHEHKDRTAAHNHSLTGTRHEQVPLDAARVPPSVMHQHMGPPTIEHDYPEDSKHKRHSISHQEAHILR